MPGAACSALGGSGGAPRVVLLGRGSSFPLPPRKARDTHKSKAHKSKIDVGLLKPVTGLGEAGETVAVSVPQWENALRRSGSARLLRNPGKLRGIRHFGGALSRV